MALLHKYFFLFAASFFILHCLDESDGFVFILRRTMAQEEPMMGRGGPLSFLSALNPMGGGAMSRMGGGMGGMGGLAAAGIAGAVLLGGLSFAKGFKLGGGKNASSILNLLHPSFSSPHTPTYVQLESYTPPQVLQNTVYVPAPAVPTQKSLYRVQLDSDETEKPTHVTNHVYNIYGSSHEDLSDLKESVLAKRLQATYKESI